MRLKKKKKKWGHILCGEQSEWEAWKWTRTRANKFIYKETSSLSDYSYFTSFPNTNRQLHALETQNKYCLSSKSQLSFQETQRENLKKCPKVKPGVSRFFKYEWTVIIIHSKLLCVYEASILKIYQWIQEFYTDQINLLSTICEKGLFLWS